MCLGFLAGLVVLVVIIGVTKPTACVHGKILPPVKKTTKNTNTVKDKKQTLKVKDKGKYKNIKVVIIRDTKPTVWVHGKIPTTDQHPL